MNEKEILETKSKKYEKIKCPFCDHGFNYYKVKEKIWQCRNCGKTFKFNEKTDLSEQEDQE